MIFIFLLPTEHSSQGAWLNFNNLEIEYLDKFNKLLILYIFSIKIEDIEKEIKSN